MGPDHIERYKSFDEYYNTKFNITKNQTEDLYFIENIDDVEIEKRASQIKAKRISVSKFKKADIFVENDKICHEKNSIIDVDKLSLKGIHNLENTLFMVATAEILKIDREKVKEFLMITTGFIEARSPQPFIQTDNIIFLIIFCTMFCHNSP